MALARYFPRIADAVTGSVPITAGELERVLGNRPINVGFDERVADVPELLDGAALLINLLARLYPAIEVSGPASVRDLAESVATSINPEIEFKSLGKSELVPMLGFGAPGTISVDASGWTASVDSQGERSMDVNSFTALIAACLGAAELFRGIFGEFLGDRSRHGAQPGSVVLAPDSVPVSLLRGIDVGPCHLAGAGAVGQACTLALGLSGATGDLTVVDPELVELSNLQRYVLTTFGDVGRAKVDLASGYLARRGWTTHAIRTRWGADEASTPGRACVIAALDSAKDRLGLAAGLHQRVYNAWTQPDDLGWSRHEAFGTEPCLACLYYPDRERPSDDELIASALGQHRLRILSYLTSRVPVGVPLPQIAAAADIAPPDDSSEWLTTSLLSDLALTGYVSSDDVPKWFGREVGDLYSEGVCGGGLIRGVRGHLEADVTVPLAHQSVMAGVMLAFEVVAASSAQLVALRSSATEGRIDLLRGLPQVLQRPRERTPHCICADPVYVAVARDIVG